MIKIIQKSFALILIFLVTNSYGGTHFTMKDEFDGSSFVAFSQTSEEATKGEFVMYLTNYDENEKTIGLIIATSIGVDCEENGLEVKSADGTIHKISAREEKLKYCYAIIPVDWVRKNFTVRVPMRIKTPLIGTMRTESFKPERYKIIDKSK